MRILVANRPLNFRRRARSIGVDGSYIRLSNLRMRMRGKLLLIAGSSAHGCDVNKTNINYLISDINNNQKHHPIMFLSKLKNYIQTKLTSLQSHKPKPPLDPLLQKKLKYYIDHIFSSSTQVQFKAYHELQSPQINLNHLLELIYHGGLASNQHIVAIINFYCFLLTNCSNQLVVCKIVSDGFVQQLTQIYIRHLFKPVQLPLKRQNLEETLQQIPKQYDLEQINAYKVALIKAYVSKINSETLKYMAIGQKIPILQNCINVFWSYLDIEDRYSYGVETTCIGNCLLLLIKNINLDKELCRFIYGQSQSKEGQEISIKNKIGQKSLRQLVQQLINKIHHKIILITKSSQIEQQELQLLESQILFLIDIFHSMAQESYKQSIANQAVNQLKDMVKELESIIQKSIFGCQVSINSYRNSISLVNCIFKFLILYGTEKSVVAVFEKHLVAFLEKFINFLGKKMSNITALQKQQDQLDKKSFNKERDQLLNIFCCNMEIMARVLKCSSSLFSHSSLKSEKIEEQKQIIVCKLLDVIEIIISQQSQILTEHFCVKSIKFLLFSLLQLTFQTKNPIHEYSILKLHQKYIKKFKAILKNVQHWDYISMNYQPTMRNLSFNLLNIEQTDLHEHNFCIYHDPLKSKNDSSYEQHIKNMIQINQCCRNFRFMMVQKTYVQLHQIKLEKTYHSNFVTDGWKLQPGLEIDEVEPKCQLTYLANQNRLPIIVIEDDECLIFAVKIQEQQQDKTQEQSSKKLKILINIRYKNIHSFTLSSDKDLIQIKLKGIQQIIVEPNDKNSKGNIKKFKQYLIGKRDKSRGRQLMFINMYLDLYQKDNQRVMADIGQKQMGLSSLEPTKEQIETEKDQQQNELIQEKNEKQEQIQRKQIQFSGEKDQKLVPEQLQGPSLVVEAKIQHQQQQEQQ